MQILTTQPLTIATATKGAGQRPVTVAPEEARGAAVVAGGTGVGAACYREGRKTP